jgi:hypothetical protein
MRTSPRGRGASARLRGAASVKQARSEGENVAERSWTGEEVIRTAQRRGRLLLEIEASGAKKRGRVLEKEAGWRVTRFLARR